MRWRHGSKNVVIALSLLAAGAYGSYLFVRSQGGFSPDWTDGGEVYGSLRGDDIRFAVWEDPEPVGGDVSSEAIEGRSALSPDGRFLVFEVGERGLNADLWIADMIDGRPRDARPLERLASGFDELAPAFGPGYLYFASDRAGLAYGLDVWRSEYEDGRFGAPEALATGLNTAADETDPLPLPGGDEIVFASNRPRGARVDFDLYTATPRVDAEGFDVLALAELNGPFDERDPAATADGSVLVFASDRGSPRSFEKRSFDLYRSLTDGAVWLPPRALDGVNSGASERGPLLSPDGFSLLYSRTAEGPDAGARADLYRARSRELFRLPAPPVGLIELLTLLAFLLLALLAWLARTWPGMEVIYKCFLVSLLVHLLLLWLLRHVHPEGSPFSFGGDDKLFRVQLENRGPTADASNRERGGELSAERTLDTESQSPGRSTFETRLASATPAARSVTLERHEEALPGRRGLELLQPEAPRSESVVRLQDDAQPFERLSGEAPELAVEAGAGRAAPARSDGGHPDRATSAPGRVEPVAASLRSVARGERAADTAPAPAVVTAAPAARPVEGGVEVAVAQPVEEIARNAGDVPGFTLPAAAATPAPSRDASGPERAQAENELAVSSTPGASPLPQEPLASPNRPAEVALPQRRDLGQEVAQAARERPRVELDDRASEDAVHALPATPPREFDATEALATRMDAPQTGRPLPEEHEPRRFAAEGRRSDEALPESQALIPARATGPAADQVPRPALVSAEPSTRPVEGGVEVAIAQPVEELARDTGEIPGLALPAATATAAPTRDASGPERASARNELAVSSTTGASPLPRDPLAAPKRPAERDSGLPPRRDIGREIAQAERERPHVELDDRAQDELTPARGATPPEKLDLTEVLALKVDPPPRERPRPEELQPSRFELDRRADADALPDYRALAAAPAPGPAADDVPDRIEHTPYRNRFGEEKARALELYGGDEETERAVAEGLAYLASIQRRQGYWGSTADRHEKYEHVLMGKTGLSLLAFLGAGHTHVSDTQYSGVVRRTIDFLLANQDEGTGHFGVSSAYSHGIVTYALAECYAITQDDDLRRPLERAIRHILRQQNDRPDRRLFGGWGYYYPDGRVWNNDRWPRVSVTAWQVMALESARIGGLEVPDQAFEDARAFVLNAWDDDRGVFRYCHDPQRLSSGYPVLPASTPAGMFALSLLGVDLEHPDLAAARRFVLERAPREYRYRSDDAFVYDAVGNLYFWYYATLAMFRTGGSSWDRWNAQMKDALLNGQEVDGSWEPISVYADYAGDDDLDRSYSTAMCVLTLEIYYRYFTPLLEVEVK